MTTPSKIGIDDFFALGKTRADAEACIVESLPDMGDVWEPPSPLDEPAGPPFPVEALPGMLGDYVSAIATSTQTDPGLAATMALGILSTAGRGRYVVRVEGTDWREPVIAQIIAFLASAERKTAVVEEMKRAVLNYEQEQQTKDRDLLTVWESDRRILQKQLDTAEVQVGKDFGPDAKVLKDAALEALLAHDKKRPIITRLLISNATPPAIDAMLAEQGGALAQIDDEGTLATTIANPWGGKGAPPLFDFLLHGHNHGTIRVHRKGGPELYTPRASFSFAIACQPHVAETMGGIDGFRNRGGAARIWTAFLTSNVGYRTLEAGTIPAGPRAAWDEKITAILDHDPRNTVDSGGYKLPRPLDLDSDATSVFRAYWYQVERDLQPHTPMGSDRHLRSWGGKAGGMVLRIAGFLHVSITETPEDHPITGDTMTRAVTIGRYFTEHAVIFHGVMAGGGGQSDARQVLTVLQAMAEESGEPITRRNLHRKMKGRLAFRSPDSLAKPLTLLEDLGHIRRKRAPGPDGGRPSEIITVNPWCQSAKSATTPPVTDDTEGFGTFGTSALSVVPEPTNLRQLTPRYPLPPTGTDGNYTEDI